ncbi:MAG: non-homologous end-joining DNA ligase [Acidimicrobiia bacterium]|nr:non-homologous end-joining DNA ligase [Acidimicrobiia bacterium]MDX2467374.1 non-homologous end-joining DNA ligase [Acidimicrobiia bacterium]
MLASPWDTTFSDPAWTFELKWDGVRCLMYATDAGVQLQSRAGNDLAARYPELVALDLPPNTVLDGEVVAIDESGRPSFQRLQSRRGVDGGGGIVPITYVVFDLLHHGESLVGAPLEDRVGHLARLDLPAPLVVADSFRGDSRPVWDFVVANDLEGIVAKRLSSRYQPGKRSPDWRKIGQFKQVRAVVGGFTAGTGAREPSFGALLLGLQDGDKLRWIGAVGSGFNDKSLRAIRGALDEMTVGQSPFQSDLEIPAGATWVQPRLVAMVRYKQWTTAGRLRAPSFQGMTDTPVGLASWEAEGPPAA